MELVKQLLLALGLLGSPVDHPPEPCLGNCKPSPAAVGIIKHFEGYSPFRYRDSAGLWTIGVGHLIRPGEHFDEPLLGNAAEKLFQQDLKPKAAAVNARVLVPLYQGQFDASVSLVYNSHSAPFFAILKQFWQSLLKRREDELRTDACMRSNVLFLRYILVNHNFLHPVRPISDPLG